MSRSSKGIDAVITVNAPTELGAHLGPVLLSEGLGRAMTNGRLARSLYVDKPKAVVLAYGGILTGSAAGGGAYDESYENRKANS